MGLFGWKEKKELEVYHEVASRDRRVDAQVNDVRKLKKLEAFQAAVIATVIVTLLFLLFGCTSKCDTPAESLEQRFTVGKCVDNIRDSVVIDTTRNTFNSICECEEHCKKIKEAIENSKKDSTLREYLLKYGPTCKCN